jgi:hypothetical protein
MNEPDLEIRADAGGCGVRAHRHRTGSIALQVRAVAGDCDGDLRRHRLRHVLVVRGAADLVGQQVQQFPLAAGQEKEPPPPRLQTQPFKDVHLLRQEQLEKLSSYGWVDQGTASCRIPIEEAMRIVAERNAVATTGQDAPGGFNHVVQDSSGGRTTAPRRCRGRSGPAGNGLQTGRERTMKKKFLTATLIAMGMTHVPARSPTCLASTRRPPRRPSARRPRR